MRLTTTGFKAHDRALDLGDRTILAGPCGTGKSTVMDALTWLFLGHVPRLGKKLDATADLMRGREMSAELTLDDGRVIVRTLARKKAGSLTQSVRCSWLPDGAGQDEHEAVALALVGSDAESAAEALDIRSLINATGPRRTARIQQLLSAGQMDAGERVMLVAELVTRRLTDSETRDVDWTALTPLIPGTGRDGAPHTGVRAVLRDAQAELKASLADGGFQSAKAWANAEKNRAAKEARERKAAHAEFEARVGELAEVDEEALAEDEARLRSLDERIGAARAALAAAEAQVEQRAAAERKLAEAKRACVEAEAQAAAAEEVAAEREQIERDLRQIKREYAAAPSFVAEPEPAGIATMQETARWAREQAAQIDVTLPSDADVVAARKAVEEADLALSRAEADPWCQVVDRARWLSDAIGGNVKAAATREQMQAACADLVALAESQGYEREDVLRFAADQKREALEKALAAFDGASDAHRANLAERARLLREADAFDAQATQLRKEHAERQREALAAWSAGPGAELRQMEARAQALQEKLQRLPHVNAPLAAEKAARFRDAVVAAEEALAAFPEPTTAGASGVDTGERDRLAGEIRAKHATLNTRAELQRLVDALALADAEREVFAAIEWACAEALAREAQAAGRALLDPMRAFLRAAGRAEDPFCEATAQDFRIGWRRPDGAEVSVRTLCGGEWPVFVAALSAAVHANSTAPVKLVLVEAGETDDAHLQQIMDGLLACDDVTAIVAAQRDAVGVPLGWGEIKTRAHVAERAAA